MDDSTYVLNDLPDVLNLLMYVGLELNGNVITVNSGSVFGKWLMFLHILCFSDAETMSISTMLWNCHLIFY